jgi:serine/threonine protein kinase
MEALTKINNEYVLGERIGSGAFGEIFQAQHITTRQLVAVKLEPVDSKVP